ncbi:hypothetical protein BKA62DRAFT_704462 [Auriculariales sp. MPI-PUGE-AT-0066]|nr:hypothetical protein BKA62DRAFT_704462 [Auriculariales sp. MPI-PUGE-AT-0066]
MSGTCCPSMFSQMLPLLLCASAHGLVGSSFFSSLFGTGKLLDGTQYRCVSDSWWDRTMDAYRPVTRWRMFIRVA